MSTSVCRPQERNRLCSSFASLQCCFQSRSLYFVWLSYIWFVREIYSKVMQLPNQTRVTEAGPAWACLCNVSGNVRCEPCGCQHLCNVCTKWWSLWLWAVVTLYLSLSWWLFIGRRTTEDSRTELLIVCLVSFQWAISIDSSCKWVSVYRRSQSI